MSNPFDITESQLTEPESLLIGSFSQWRRLLDYSDATYTLAYRFISEAGGAPKTVAGTFDEENEWWTFSIGIAGMTGWSTGRYRWDLVLTRISDSEAAIVSTGSLIVHGTTSDRRTHAEIMLRKIESLLEGRADSDIESYSVKSRSLTKMSVKELREWREYYAAEVERTGGSASQDRKPPSSTVRVRWI